MRVRDARPDEYDDIGRFTVAAYRALPGYERSPVMVTYETELAAVRRRATTGTSVLVAVDDHDRPVGAVALVLGDTDWFEHRYGVDGDCGFRMLAVDPGAQQQGAGRALVTECITRARAAGRSNMVISSTPPMTVAHRMYEQFGFVRRPDLDQWWGPVHGMAFSLDLGTAR